MQVNFHPGFDDRVFTPIKLAATVDLLAAQGVAVPWILKGTQLSADDLGNPATRISVNQLIECYRNATRLSRDPHIGYRIGSTIHLPAYGMYGFAMLSSTSARRSMECAVKYHPLAAPTCSISFAERGRLARWTVEPIHHPRMDEALYAFVTELQIAIHVSLHRDTMGDAFVPREVLLTYAAPAEPQALSALIGCPVRYNQPVNQMVYDAHWLDIAPRFGNRVSFAATVASCDEQLAEMTQRCGIAGKVRSIILRDIANHPDFSSTARLLQTTPRTLRRQLRQQNTSFQQLLDEVRAEVAARYLQKTAMTNEEIAFALGFSDAANFRHAFRRWTNTTPREFRALDRVEQEFDQAV